MPLVADVGRVDDIALVIGLEGMEYTIGDTVLISQVDVHPASPEAETAGKAVGVFPIDVIGRRGVHRT